MTNTIIIGNYLRTDDGLIAKIVDIEKTFEDIIMITDTKDRIYSGYEEDLKMSNNIIDLIEVGDYVNGYLVEEIYQPINKEIGKLIKFSTDNVSGWEYEAEEIRENDIKSIVTKEQFESMEYKVKEVNNDRER